MLLTISNTFMAFAWYGHLKFKELSWLSKLGLAGIIVVSWFIALAEYIFQVPANRIGYKENGGPFSLIELKVIQEVVSIGVFVIFSTLLFKETAFKWNHILAFVLIIAAVYLVFKK